MTTEIEKTSSISPKLKYIDKDYPHKFNWDRQYAATTEDNNIVNVRQNVIVNKIYLFERNEYAIALPQI